MEPGHSNLLKFGLAPAYVKTADSPYRLQTRTNPYVRQQRELVMDSHNFGEKSERISGKKSNPFAVTQ